MASVVQIDLPAVLPDIPTPEDPCVRRLLASIAERDGVLRSHLIAESFGEPATLCVHFDPEEIDQSHLREAILKTGTRLCEQFGHATWTTPSISDPRRAGTAADKLCQVRGVIAAEVELDSRIRVEYDRERIQETELRGVLALMSIQLDRQGQ